MTAAIHLGYVVGTGEAVEIPLRHTAVTGQTQESGKTTTLEGLISRSGLQAVAYVTKRGESSFHVMHPIPPYFQERADWKFVKSILEAAMETRMDFKEPWIMRVADGAKTLEDVHANVKRFIHGVKEEPRALPRRGRNPNRKDQQEPKERWKQKPARGLSGDVYYVLDKYFEEIMPQIASLPYTTELELAPGLNVMDLRDYEFPLQALVIRSVLDYTRLHGIEIINLVPEAWKFAPKQKGSPVRQSAEELIREGGALKNFLWIDSQDLAGVADVLMRQVGVWLFGVQRAKHEIERALDHMPEGLPARRPRPADIATLQKGQFYVCFGREMYKVYVQPAWMTAAHAEAIARGEEEVDSAREILKEYAHEHKAKSSPREMSKGHETQHTDLGSHAVANRDSEKQRSLRSPGAASDQQRLATDVDSEEAMWKEKYEALKAEFEELQRTAGMVTTAAKATQDAVNLRASSNGDLDSIYRYVVDRAGREMPPALVRVIAERPELQIKRERKTIDADASTLRSALGILISEKFFDGAREFGDVRKDLIRRGFLGSKAPNLQISQALQGLVKLGFLTKEDSGYQAVPGMKVNIVEA